ncbi:hypothetical protein Leryth_027626, partial [Lithospermum erythrorhizon]
MDIPKTVVAKGVLVSKYPEEKVDNVPLGRDIWKDVCSEMYVSNYEFRIG